MKMPLVVWVSCLAAIICSGLPARAHAASGAPVQCGDPKSLAGYFLSVVREIALNGGLTDRKSLETILETKFDAPWDVAGGQGAPHTVYASTTMFGRPTRVVYDRTEGSDGKRQAIPVISLTITMPPSWPALLPATVESCFADAGGQPQRRQRYGAPGSSWTKSIPRALAGGERLLIAWSDGENRDRVDEVAIFLNP